MATINPSNLYSGMAVVFNSNPATQFAINALARKQAKDEALEQYYQNLNQSVNPAGVRMNDMEGLHKRTNEWRDFYQQNRDKIKNPRLDNGASQTEYQKRYQELQGYIARSKSAEAAKKPFVDMLSDPAKRERVSDLMLQGIQLHDLPLDDENRTDFDIAKYNFDPKQFEQDKFIKLFDDIERGERIAGVVRNPDGLTNTITKEKYFDNDAKQAIAERARMQYMADPSFHKMINDLGNDDAAIKKLSKTFENTFGRPLMYHEDVAIAYTLNALQPTIQNQEIKEDKAAVMDRQEAHDRSMEAQRQANRRAIMKYRKQLGGDDEELDDETWLDGYLDEVEESATPIADGMGVIGERGYKRINVDPVLATALRKGDFIPEELEIAPDGTYIPKYYRYDNDGNRILYKEISIPITRTQLKVSAGVKVATGKQRVKEINSGKKKSNTEKLDW